MGGKSGFEPLTLEGSSQSATFSLFAIFPKYLKWWRLTGSNHDPHLLVRQVLSARPKPPFMMVTRTGFRQCYRREGGCANHLTNGPKMAPQVGLNEPTTL